MKQLAVEVVRQPIEYTVLGFVVKRASYVCGYRLAGGGREVSFAHGEPMILTHKLEDPTPMRRPYFGFLGSLSRKRVEA